MKAEQEQNKKSKDGMCDGYCWLLLQYRNVLNDIVEREATQFGVTLGI